jgi:uncharacterized hydrophobic protein (TIGR00271 family)
MSELTAHGLEAARERIRDGASLDTSYVAMNILAATIASYGLLANSPAVVIGAMIIAMLLGPILGLGLATVDSDARLFVNAAATLVSGAFAVMAAALIIGVVHRPAPLTGEIMARTSPNLFDLMIALAGGAAGAFAIVSPRLSVAFVGVAIATAVVPPLASASILVAHNQMPLALGAVLLAVTNMVAIQFACSAVLWFAGVRRRVDRTRGAAVVAFARRNAVGLAIMMVLGVTLTINLNRVIGRELYETTTRAVLRRALEALEGSHLTEVRFEGTPRTTIIRAVVRGPAPPSAAQIAAMEDQLPAPPDGTRPELRVRFVETVVLTRKGRSFTDTEAAD